MRQVTPGVDSTDYLLKQLPIKYEDQGRLRRLAAKRAKYRDTMQYTPMPLTFERGQPVYHATTRNAPIYYNEDRKPVFIPFDDPRQYEPKNNITFPPVILHRSCRYACSYV